MNRAQNYFESTVLWRREEEQQKWNFVQKERYFQFQPVGTGGKSGVLPKVVDRLFRQNFQWIRAFNRLNRKGQMESA